jgi:putative membrane protein insertion efficiency factor
MIKKFLKVVLGVYKSAVSPFLGPACRFHPSCSSYALDAVENHGAARGVFLAVKRLLRCHPFNPGGYDPVEHPAAEKEKY